MLFDLSGRFLLVFCVVVSFRTYLWQYDTMRTVRYDFEEKKQKKSSEATVSELIRKVINFLFNSIISEVKK